MTEEDVEAWMRSLDREEAAWDEWWNFYDLATQELGPEPARECPPTCAEVVEAQGEEIVREALVQWRRTQSRTACNRGS